MGILQEQGARGCICATRILHNDWLAARGGVRLYTIDLYPTLLS